MLHPHRCVQRKESRAQDLRWVACLLTPGNPFPKASRATVLRGSQCPQVYGGCSSLTKTEVGDAAMEMGS